MCFVLEIQFRWDFMLYTSSFLIATTIKYRKKKKFALNAVNVKKWWILEFEILFERKIEKKNRTANELDF